MRRSAPLAALVLLLAACGSGQDPTVDGAGAPATTSTTAAAAGGDTLPATGDTTAAEQAGVGAGATVPGADPADVDPAVPGEPGGAAPAGFGPPAAGTYTFHTTGTGPPESLLGPPRQIDEQTTTTIAALSADTVRQTTTSSEGSQTVELRYEAGRVALLLLEVTFGGGTLRFVSADGITFSPVPPTAGQTWHGQLVDESGQLTLTFDGASQPPEVVTVLGRSVEAFVIDATIHITGTYSGFPVDATVQVRAWVDPVLRTQVRSHQVTTLTQPVSSTSDTTSELVGVTPA